jgi:hypothetical protein
LLELDLVFGGHGVSSPMKTHGSIQGQQGQRHGQPSRQGGGGGAQNKNWATTGEVGSTL